MHLYVKGVSLQYLEINLISFHIKKSTIHIKNIMKVFLLQIQVYFFLSVKKTNY